MKFYSFLILLFFIACTSCDEIRTGTEKICPDLSGVWIDENENTWDFTVASSTARVFEVRYVNQGENVKQVFGYDFSPNEGCTMLWGMNTRVINGERHSVVPRHLTQARVIRDTDNELFIQEWNDNGSKNFTHKLRRI